MHLSPSITSVSRSRSQGFSLLELLAVIATIATLAALLLPVLGKAKARAHQTTCLSNLRQLGLSWVMYYQDNAGYLAQACPENNPDVWVRGDMRDPAEAMDATLLESGKLYPYHRNTGIYRCPTDKGVEIDGRTIQNVRSYSMNGFMGARPPSAPQVIPPTATAFVPFFAKDSDLQRPEQLSVLIDEDNRSINDGFFVTDPSARIWYDFPSISPQRHSYRFTLNFADGHADSFALQDRRTREVNHHQAEDAGNPDLSRLARTVTVRK